MAGIYVHIPFCKSRCIYCDFFSTTLLELRDSYVEALCKEISIEKGYLNGDSIQTIYFGGGTPSQLSSSQLGTIINSIHSNFQVTDSSEITIELNPDDVTLGFAESLKMLSFNRVSLGIQSFDDQRLEFINRRHSSQKAIDAVHILQSVGFNNISIDLIFGFPNQTLDQWKSDIDMALSLGVQHISAYSLMYEEGTKLYKLLETNKVQEIDDELSLLMYQTLIDKLTKTGYLHYEISNFALPGYHSRHNSSYWESIPYLGLGAGAHSYNKESRRWNVCDLKSYINAINDGTSRYETEILSKDQKYDEFVMTRLRTAKGLKLEELRTNFGDSYYNHFVDCATPYIKEGVLQINQENNCATLTRKGIYTSNDIISSLFI